MSKWQVKTLAIIKDDGSLNMGDILQFKAELKLHKTEMIRLVATPYDPKKEEEELRTLRQNRYYHKLLDIICDHTGDLHLELHEKLKVKLLGRPYILDDREVIIVPSTKDLTTKTFGDYLEKVFAFTSEEYGLVLPSPTSLYE